MSRLEQPTNEACAIAEQGGGTTKVEQLIQQYCPDGVEYRPIWSLTAWDKKFNGIDKSKQKKIIKYNYLLAADLKSYQVEGGTVKLLTTNISNLYTTEELAEDLASDGEVVAIPWGGNPVVQYYKGRFLTADNRIATSLDTTLLNNKFLYYCMLSRMKLIASFYRGSGIKHPEMAKVLDLEIPVPPLPVQEEIVRILDKFAELQAELQAKLQAELQKRLQQYNYYRDKLLSFSELNRWGQSVSVEWKKLGEICLKVCSGGTPSRGNSNYFTGDIPWLRTQEVDWNDIYDTEIKITEDAVKNSSAKLIPENCVIIAMYGATAGKVGINKIPLTTNQACCNLQINPQKALYKYVYYWVCNEYEHLKSLGQGSQNNINAQIIKEYPIPVPPLSEQQRIVDILDRFDTLTTDITAGLPAEIEARRKQYEYYRDQLLTFKQKAS